MIKLRQLVHEFDYPLAKGSEIQSYGGMEGWKGKIVWMSPDKFLQLANPLPEEYKKRKEFDTIKNALKDRFKRGLPTDFLVLEVDVERKKVIGHEGRHRAIAAKELGIDTVPVLIFTGSNFKRVPDWTPADHAMINSMAFKPEYIKERDVK
jgi:hypothetical protein